MAWKEPAVAAGPLIDQEADLIGSAMRLVASGVSPRATVAGLRLTDAALAVATPRAAALGVRVEAIWRPDRTGHDVVVTRLVAGRPAGRG